MKKILITGSNGLLGQKLVYKLKTLSGTEVIATAQGNNRLINTNGYTYQSLDINDREAVIAVIQKHLPDTIIHTAAMTNVDACETQKELCYKTNTLAVQYIVEALEKSKKSHYKPHLIHVSTDFIFDGKAGPYKEDDKPNPLSYYAYCKNEAEQIVIHSSIDWAVARTMLVYGITDNMSRSNIVLWVKQSLEQGKQINVVDDQFRCPTLAEDLAEGCLLIAQKRATGIYHLSGKDFMSIYDLACRVARYYNLDEKLIIPVKSSTLNQPAKRPPKTGFIIDRAISKLGYAPHSFEEGLDILNRQLLNIKT
jgi:dTDP-4-dehydrorhamnose reductase